LFLADEFDVDHYAIIRLLRYALLGAFFDGLGEVGCGFLYVFLDDFMQKTGFDRLF
jgi:hypothetical protein